MEIKTMNAGDMLLELSQFTGSENWYKSGLGSLLLTDGMQWLCRYAGAFWLSDIVESVQHLKAVSEQSSFLVWNVQVEDDKTCTVSAWTDKPKSCGSIEVYHQDIKYTDFPLSNFEFFQCDNVLLLKSEY